MDRYNMNEYSYDDMLEEYYEGRDFLTEADGDFEANRVNEKILAKDMLIDPSKIELDDGDQRNEEGMFYGGIQYVGECLDNFLGEIEKDFDTLTMSELLEFMNEGNVKFKDIENIYKKE